MANYQIREEIRVTFFQGSPLSRLVVNRKRKFEKPVDVVKRMMLRYDQLLTNSKTPNPEFVSQLAQVVSKVNLEILYQDIYPTHTQLLQVIEQSTLPEHKQVEFTRRINSMDFATFAKLIEALENFYGS